MHFKSKRDIEYFLDPVSLPGDGQYNLNILKEINVTESFIGLAKDVRNCQNIETYDECTTRHLLDKMRENCRCLPLSLIGTDKVKRYISPFQALTYLIFYRIQFA